MHHDVSNIKKENTMPNSTFKAHDGISLYSQEWACAEAAGHIALIHGYGEHIGRYERLADAFLKAGYSVSGYDHRNHGKSPGKRGFIERFDYLVDDARCFVEHEKQQAGERPFFILGHSMGGLTLARLLQRYDISASGVIFSSPFLQIADDISPALIAVGNLLSAVLPNLPVVDLKPEKISRVPEEVEAYKNDPLVFHGRIVARTGSELNKAVALARADMSKIVLPCYILHGKSDQLAPVGGGEFMYEHVLSMDKTLKLYDDAYHELFNDYGRENVVDDLLSWVRERSA